MNEEITAAQATAEYQRKELAEANSRANLKELFLISLPFLTLWLGYWMGTNR